MTPAIRSLQQLGGLLLIVGAGSGAIVWCLGRVRDAIEETRWPDVSGAIARRRAQDRRAAEAEA